MGLARALGMNLRKDAFSDANMKSRDHQIQLKEKLIFCLWKKLNEENRDLNPIQVTIDQTGSSLETEVDGETNDSTSTQTPKSKNKALGKHDSSEQSGI